MITTQPMQPLEKLVSQNLAPDWNITNKACSVVVALMVEEAKKQQAQFGKGSPVYFTIPDIKRIVFRAYLAPDSVDYLGDTPSLTGKTMEKAGNGRKVTEEAEPMRGYLEMFRENVNAALTSNGTPLKTLDQLQEAVILDKPKRRKYAYGVVVIGELVTMDAKHIMNILTKRSTPPRLTKDASVKIALPDGGQATGYLFTYS